MDSPSEQFTEGDSIQSRHATPVVRYVHDWNHLHWRRRSDLQRRSLCVAEAYILPQLCQTPPARESESVCDERPAEGRRDRDSRTLLLLDPTRS